MSQKTVDLVKLGDLIRCIPLEDLPEIVTVATGTVIEEIDTQNMPWEPQREYFLHSLDMATHIDELRDYFRGVPADQVQLLISQARQANWKSEFDIEGLVRQARPNEPYWFENHILVNCRAHLSEGEPGKAFGECLIDSNHGHSGFVSQVQRVYFAPANNDERLISGVLRRLHYEVAEALLCTVDASADILTFMDVQAIFVCLHRQGRDFPVDLACELRELISGCLKIDPDFAQAKQLSDQVLYRFKV